MKGKSGTNGLSASVVVFLVGSVLVFPTVCNAGEISVRSDFSGGSAEILTIDQNQRVIKMNPSAHSDRNRGWRCWWYCRIEGLVPGEEIQLDVGDAPWATPDMATWSADHIRWSHTEPGVREGKRIKYKIKAAAETIWVAWGPPFLLSDAERLISELAKHPSADAFNLSDTREGRRTPALSVSDAPKDGKRIGIWIQARQHAWESGSSWVGKGFAEWLLSDDEMAVELRKKSHVTFVPIMDVDNVERGAGGKNQKPQDHNRDWSEAPHWHSVRAAQKSILAQKEEGRFDLFVDLHNPGAQNKDPYYYVPPEDLLKPIGKRNLASFVEASKNEISGPLRFKGKTLASGSKYDAKAWFAISKNWVSAHCAEHVVSVTLETPWNTPGSTTEGYLRVGRELGRAITRYLRDDVRSADAPAPE